LNIAGELGEKIFLCHADAVLAGNGSTEPDGFVEDFGEGFERAVDD
jgi:hypothetical protein